MSLNKLDLHPHHWVKVKHDLPAFSGPYLCWNAEKHLVWMDYWNDHDLSRQLGWQGTGVPTATHWTEIPITPDE